MNTKAVAIPFVLGPGEGPAIRGPVGGDIIFKVRGKDTGGSFLAMENVVLSGEGPPLHLHPNEDEYFYVLEGEFRFRTNDEVKAAPAGSFVRVPRTVPHCFQNIGGSAGRLLIMFTPAGMESFYENLAKDPERDAEAFARAGADAEMQVLGPTLAVSHPL